VFGIYRLTEEKFPRDEKYGLSAQLHRSTYSVAANIVEGYADRSNRWWLRYLRIALGSLAEASLHFAHRLQYLSSAAYAEIDKQVSGTAAPLHGLLNRMRAAVRESDNS
jgi:four helix bundle protein